MRDGLLGGAGAVFVVADDAAQQAIVGGGNVVVVVEQQGCECGGIDSEFVSVVHTFCQSRVERVNAFEDEDVVLLEFQFPSARNAFPGEEVIARRFNLFSGSLPSFLAWLIRDFAWLISRRFAFTLRITML